MHIQTRFESDLTVRSFAYVAGRLAEATTGLAPSAQYEQILGEAEKHRSALRLMLRDVLERVEQGLRGQVLTAAECQRLRDAAAPTIEQAQQAISRILAQYAVHPMAA